MVEDERGRGAGDVGSGQAEEFVARIRERYAVEGPHAYRHLAEDAREYQVPVVPPRRGARRIYLEDVWELVQSAVVVVICLYVLWQFVLWWAGWPRR